MGKRYNPPARRCYTTAEDEEVKVQTDLLLSSLSSEPSGNVCQATELCHSAVTDGEGPRRARPATLVNWQDREAEWDADEARAARLEEPVREQ